MESISVKEADKSFRRYYERASAGEPVEIVEQGHATVYLVTKEMLKPNPQPVDKKSNPPIWGAFRGSVTHVAQDFDEPLGDAMWDACQ
jgi:antitoxin (DNA-binding transcriptional repressor) of toxin-antitoxin stability system